MIYARVLWKSGSFCPQEFGLLRQSLAGMLQRHTIPRDQVIIDPSAMDRHWNHESEGAFVLPRDLIVLVEVYGGTDDRIDYTKATAEVLGELMRLMTSPRSYFVRVTPGPSSFVHWSRVLQQS